MCHSLELLYLVLSFKIYIPEKNNSYINCLHFFLHTFSFWPIIWATLILGWWWNCLIRDHLKCRFTISGKIWSSSLLCIYSVIVLCFCPLSCVFISMFAPSSHFSLPPKSSHCFVHDCNIASADNVFYMSLYCLGYSPFLNCLFFLIFFRRQGWHAICF